MRAPVETLSGPLLVERNLIEEYFNGENPWTEEDTFVQNEEEFEIKKEFEELEMLLEKMRRRPKEDKGPDLPHRDTLATIEHLESFDFGSLTDEFKELAIPAMRQSILKLKTQSLHKKRYSEDMKTEMSNRRTKSEYCLPMGSRRMSRMSSRAERSGKYRGAGPREIMNVLTMATSIFKG